ncbi:MULTISPECIES: DinB family protein [Bacillus]|uniref:DinB family protein n=1 Tax=Bacillus TaxID=1386 RepID=UPI000BB93C61|nr:MULTISPECIES: DinB family protein [Bacillus]
MFLETEQARECLLNLLEPLDDYDFQLKVDGGWTIGEIVEHLYLIEKRIVQSMKNAVVYQLVTSNREVHLKDILKNRTRKVDAPTYLKPSGADFTKKELLSLLENSRDELKEFLDNTDMKELCLYGFTHRWIGDLTCKQWVELIGYHELRHISQMGDILSTPIIDD